MKSPAGAEHEETRKQKKLPPLHNKYNSVDAFRLATLGGAEVVNMSHLIGTIEVGKKADILIFDALTTNLAGISDPFQGVVFHASNADIDTVFINGEIVKRNGKLTRVKWESVAKELQAKAEDIRRRYPDEQLETLWVESHSKYTGARKARS